MKFQLDTTPFDPTDTGNMIAESCRKIALEMVLGHLQSGVKVRGERPDDFAMQGTLTGAACAFLAAHKGRTKDRRNAFLAIAKVCFEMAVRIEHGTPKEPTP